MSFRHQIVEPIRCSDGFLLLSHVDKVRHTQSEHATKSRNLDYDQNRNE